MVKVVYSTLTADSVPDRKRRENDSRPCFPGKRQEVFRSAQCNMARRKKRNDEDISNADGSSPSAFFVMDNICFYDRRQKSLLCIKGLDKMQRTTVQCSYRIANPLLTSFFPFCPML